MNISILLRCGFLAWVLLSSTSVAADTSRLWQAFEKTNHFVLIRHALAPGTGDPSNFQLGERDTQRNLNERGREQAMAIGQQFRENGIDQARVYSSQWFRCLDTAELLSLGPVTPLPALNSFFEAWHRRDAQTRKLRSWLTADRINEGHPLILVTHQVNISALTGTFASSGEIVVVRRGQDGHFEVIGTIQTD